MAQPPPTTEAPQKNILILGGSYGGVSTAHYLLKHVIHRLPESATYQVVLISASSQAMCRQACPRALISDDMFPKDKLFVSIPNAFDQYPKETFRFIHGTATELDHVDRTVTFSEVSRNIETISYHALVIATGASTPSPLLGLNKSEDFLRASWAAFRQALPAAKTIVISGGGPAGVETAGELGEYLNGRAGHWASKLPNPKVSVTLITASSNVLPALRPSIGEKAESYLAKVGVTIIKNTRVTSVAPAAAGQTDVAACATLTLDDGRTVAADLYIPATGTAPNTAFVRARAASASLLLAPDGRVATNAATLRVDGAGPRVYAVGDAASCARPAVHTILAAVPVLGSNIRRDLLLAAGAEEASVGVDRVFREDTRETQMVPIGRSKGVGAAMGYQVPSFLVWLIKGRDYWLWTTSGLWSGKQWAKES